MRNKIRKTVHETEKMIEISIPAKFVWGDRFQASFTEAAESSTATRAQWYDTKHTHTNLAQQVRDRRLPSDYNGTTEQSDLHLQLDIQQATYM